MFEDEDAHDDGEDEENHEEEDKGEDVHVGHVLNMSSESALEHVFRAHVHNNHNKFLTRRQRVFNMLFIC